MTLTPEELTRYARHIVLREVGGPGQMKLRAPTIRTRAARSFIWPPPVSGP